MKRHKRIACALEYLPYAYSISSVNLYIYELRKNILILE